MPRISTDKLQSGMVLGADVKDLSGRMLLKSGTDIQERHLKVLRTWGVLGVEVVGEDGLWATEQKCVLQDLPAELLAEIDAEVEQRFGAVDTAHPVMAALVELVKLDIAATSQNKVQGG